MTSADLEVDGHVSPTGSSICGVCERLADHDLAGGRVIELPAPLEGGDVDRDLGPGHRVDLVLGDHREHEEPDARSRSGPPCRGSRSTGRYWVWTGQRRSLRRRYRNIAHTMRTRTKPPTTRPATKNPCQSLKASWPWLVAPLYAPKSGSWQPASTTGASTSSGRSRRLGRRPGRAASAERRFDGAECGASRRGRAGLGGALVAPDVHAGEP